MHKGHYCLMFDSNTPPNCFTNWELKTYQRNVLSSALALGILIGWNFSRKFLMPQEKQSTLRGIMHSTAWREFTALMTGTECHLVLRPQKPYRRNFMDNAIPQSHAKASDWNTIRVYIAIGTQYQFLWHHITDTTDRFRLLVPMQHNINDALVLPTFAVPSLGCLQSCGPQGVSHWLFQYVTYVINSITDYSPIMHGHVCPL